MVTRRRLAIATIAFLALPVVLASRAKVPRHGDLRARDAAQATWTRMVQSHGLPWRTGAALTSLRFRSYPAQGPPTTRDAWRRRTWTCPLPFRRAPRRW